MMATYSPRSMEMDTPRSAWISSSPIRYVFQSSCVSMSAMGMDTTAVIRRFQYYISRGPRFDSRPNDLDAPCPAVRPGKYNGVGLDRLHSSRRQAIAGHDDAP